MAGYAYWPGAANGTIGYDGSDVIIPENVKNVGRYVILRRLANCMGCLRLMEWEYDYVRWIENRKKAYMQGSDGSC
jgi:hypothetical protein